MSVTEETLKLSVVADASDVVALTGKLEANREAMDRLAKAYSKGGMSSAEFNTQARVLAAEHIEGSKALDRLTQSAKGSSAAFNNVGYAGLTAGRSIQDFAQGGVGGILNNIEGMTMALGMGPGMAGLLTAVGVAAFIAGPFIKDFIKDMDLFGTSAEGAKGQVEKLTDRIKELTEKPIKLSVEVLELENAKRQIDEITKAIQAFDKLSNTQNEQDKASGKAVQEELDKNGPEFAAQLKTDSAKAAVANNGPLQQAFKDQAEHGQAAKEAEKDAKSARAGADTAMAQVYEAQAAFHRDKEKQAKDLSTGIQSRVEENAKLDVGQMIIEATTGTGAKQELGRKKLSGQLAKLGFDDAATAIAGAGHVRTPTEAKAAAEGTQDALDEVESEEKEDARAAKAKEAEHKQTLRINKFFDEDAQKENEDYEKNNIEGSNAVAKQLGDRDAAENKITKRRAGMVSSESPLDERAMVDALRMKQAGKSDDEIQATAWTGLTKALRPTMGGDAVGTAHEMTKQLMEALHGVNGNQANINAAMAALNAAIKQQVTRARTNEMNSQRLMREAQQFGESELNLGWPGA